MLALVASASLTAIAAGGLVPGFRPPCVPLNVVSPYQSVWSCADYLYDSLPQHWTGSIVALIGAVRVDGSTYRFMGEDPSMPLAAEQKDVVVAPTTTTYNFQAGGISLQVRFSTPSIGLDSNIVAASRPVTDVTFMASSLDGKAHTVQLYYDNTAEGAVMRTDELVWWSRPAWVGESLAPVQTLRDSDLKPMKCDIANFIADANRCNKLCYAEPRCVAYVTEPSSRTCFLKSCGAVGDETPAKGKKANFLTVPRQEGSKTLTVMQIGAASQRELAQGSDRINWGQWLVATPKDAAGLHTVMAGATACRQSFANGTYFSLKDDATGPRAAHDGWPVLSVAWDLQLDVGSKVEQHLTLAYDQVISQRFFGTDMAPLWRKEWGDALSMLEAFEASRAKDLAAIFAFDSDLVAKLTKRGGDMFATLASLAYRQVVGGTQAVHNPLTGEEWVFMKEISSDGDVSTVDVVYPAFPMFQYLYPEYFRKLLLPLLVYGNNETKAYGIDMPYNLAWAPHHLGHWPVCDLAPQHQEQMPVEESGNMLIMLAALYRVQESISYLENYWPMLDEWADYIVASLPDPGNQLCTDDFEGPSPHNTNLAAKGIVALAAYADLVRARGNASKAQAYQDWAMAFAKYWVVKADAGDRYRLQFDLPDTWSLKYNLLYQRSLDLSVFSEAVMEKESAYYRSQLQRCGVPLDSRHPYTKSDWTMWAATLGSAPQLEAFVQGLYTFANITPSRVPFSDWYDVGTCISKGFRARPVQGGLFAPMVVQESAPVERWV